MKCPNCGWPHNYVVDTRDVVGATKRRRVCTKATCKHKWTTYETNDAERVASFSQELSRTRAVLDDVRTVLSKRFKFVESELVSLDKRFRNSLLDKKGARK